MTYEAWLAQVAIELYMDAEEIEERFTDLRSLVYDSGASPREGADLLRTKM